MMWVNTPGLPEKKVCFCVVSSAFPKIGEALEGQGIEVLQVKPLSALPEPVASHSDLQLLHLGGNQILAASEADQLMEALVKKGFKVQINDAALGKTYPQDISLNFLIVEKMIFGHQQAISPMLSKIIIQKRWRFIYSRQGYARCSVCLVNSHSAITSDPTLWKLLTNVGLDVLKVPPGDILLPGYDTGFLGGCCGLIHPKKMAFTGSLERYRSGREIIRFLEKYQVEAICLTKDKMLDIGGIIPLAVDDGQCKEDE